MTEIQQEKPANIILQTSPSVLTRDRHSLQRTATIRTSETAKRADTQIYNKLQC